MRLVIQFLALIVRSSLVASQEGCDGSEPICDVSLMQIASQLTKAPSTSEASIGTEERLQGSDGTSFLTHSGEFSYGDEEYACLANAVTKRIEDGVDRITKEAVFVYTTTGKTDSFFVETFVVDKAKAKQNDVNPSIGYSSDPKAQDWTTAPKAQDWTTAPLGNQSTFLHILSQANDNRNLNVTMYDSQGWITFTRFAKGVDKYSCDWCSLCNGLVELYLGKLRNLSSDPPPPQCDRGYWKSDEDHTPTAGQLSCFDVHPDVFSPEGVRRLVKSRNYVEYTEQQWCPFKHLKQLSFNRSYYAFSPESEADLREAQAILQEKGRITGEDVTCDKCNKVINQNMTAPTDGQEVSLFDDAEFGASYMDLLRCALGVSCSVLSEAIADSRRAGFAESTTGGDWRSYTSCLAEAGHEAPS